MSPISFNAKDGSCLYVKYCFEFVIWRGLVYRQQKSVFFCRQCFFGRSVKSVEYHNFEFIVNVLYWYLMKYYLWYCSKNRRTHTWLTQRWLSYATKGKYSTGLSCQIDCFVSTDSLLRKCSRTASATDNWQLSDKFEHDMKN